MEASPSFTAIILKQLCKLMESIQHHLLACVPLANRTTLQRLDSLLFVYLSCYHTIPYAMKDGNL
uniref:Secreted protein n=1 Tax=Heterorhabditis bacteriophora TaxID=37862 RepID=A0A1I7XPR4_HETBA